jgi:class 3 adenylate cyclase/tetratricopeptide (TPR) repeat protein
MQCPQCHTESPEGARFCLHCGEKLVEICPECETSLPVGARFCLQCGAKIAVTEAVQLGGSEAMTQAIQRLIPKAFAERLLATRGQVSHERRLVTILFSDVRGSTAMGEQLDPEELMEIMSGAFEFLIQPIYHYEGTLARLMGDAVLAFFGAPIAHEDDPERAIRAGLEIVQGAGEYAARLEREQGIGGFSVRVGINTGLVVVGEVGSDLRVEYTAMGDAVNLAARIEQAAPPGAILISHDSYRHVRGVFDVQPQDPLAVKGKSEPVLTYLVQSAKPRAFRVETRGVEGIETRMVGRDAELLILQNNYLDALDEAETHVVTVVGEAGVGKSRLLDEFFNWAELRPETFYYFRGRAASTTQAVPYQLWRDLFAYRFEILESDTAAKAMSKFRQGMAGVLEPERADLVGQLVGFDFAAAGSEAVQALSGSPNFLQLARAYLVQYFRGLLGQNSLVMLLEDLQWADDSSLDLVAHLVAEILDAPLLIVAAARPALFEQRPNWGEGREAYGRLELRPLSKRATRGLVEEILQKAAELPEALRELIVEAAEGNPYYVEELIKMLIEDGVIVRAEPHWQMQLDRLAEVRVPPTLTAVLQVRLDALPQGEKAVLQRASVVGRQFWDRLVAELASDAQEVTEVEPLLRALREHELVFQREQSAFADAREYTFKHSILRDVTYETVLRKLRRRYHAQVAGWLEAHAGERLGEYLGLVARHYELAAEAVKAAEYLQRAGEEAYKVGSLRDARDSFARALGLLPAGCEAQRATLLVRTGEALDRLGELSTAAERLEQGLALAKQVADRRVQAAALVALGHVAHMRGNWDAAESHVRAGLALARECGDVRGQAQAAVLVSMISIRRGQHDQAEAWAKEGLSLYDQIGDRQGVGTALNCLGMASLLRWELDRAAQYCRQNLTLCEEIGDRVGASRALNDLGEVARKQSDYEQARTCYQETLAISSETGNVEMHAIAVINLGMVYLAQGEDSAAWRCLCDGLRESSAMQAKPNALYVLAVMAQLCVRGGERRRAGELLGLVLHHPSTDAENVEEAQPALEALREAMPAEELEAAMARGAELDLEQVVEEILAESRVV